MNQLFPKQLILEKELINKNIKNVLFYHNTDRWYFGDLLRHASWIKSLIKAKLEISVATNNNFLPIFSKNKLINNLIPVDIIKEKDFGKYDLVIIPSSFKPEYYSPLIRRGIYSYNDALEYTRNGSIISTIKKNDLNYFRLATHKFGQTFLPDGGCFKIKITDKERKLEKHFLDKLFGRSNKKIIIVNPTSSNLFTRETNIEKEVPCTLTLDDSKLLLKYIYKFFPDHNILLGSAIKANDTQNFELLKQTAKSINSNNIKSVTDLITLNSGISFREFASILSDKRISGMIGNGTGTNTHFAAMLDLPSMSIERGADKETVKNWQNKNDLFKVGSFRWRNPNNKVGIHCIDWNKRNENNFYHIGKSFKYHLLALENEWDDIFSNVKKVKNLAKKILIKMNKSEFNGILKLLKQIAKQFKDADIRKFYFDFKDELEYAKLEHKELIKSISFIKKLGESDIENIPHYSGTSVNILLSLFNDSNLYKLIFNIASIRGGNLNHVYKNNLVIDIFRKIRAGSPISKKNLSILGFKNEELFCNWICKKISFKIRRLILKYFDNKEHKIIGSWQQDVYSKDNESYILKTINTNKKSLYFTEKWALDSIKVAIKRAGGLIPHQTDEKILKNKYHHLAKKVYPLVNMPVINNTAYINKIISGKSRCFSTEFNLSIGWIDEFLDNFLLLLRRGAYNVDVKIIDSGIDEFGSYYFLDIGSLKDRDFLKKENSNLLLNEFHLGINELLISREFLFKLKNGEELVKYYQKKIQEITKIDLTKIPFGWKWGDHKNEYIKPFTKQFKIFVKKMIKLPHPLPVYPLINEEIEKEIFSNIDIIISKVK